MDIGCSRNNRSDCELLFKCVASQLYGRGWTKWMKKDADTIVTNLLYSIKVCVLWSVKVYLVSQWKNPVFHLATASFIVWMRYQNIYSIRIIYVYHTFFDSSTPSDILSLPNCIHILCFCGWCHFVVGSWNKSCNNNATKNRPMQMEHTIEREYE